MSTTISLDPPTTGAPSQTAPTSPSLPPPPRDWQAYRLDKVQQLSTRAAAEKLGISQTRVCQLIDRIEQYLFEIAPGDESPAARSRRLYIAESVAAERIDFLFRQAVEKFEQSAGPQKTIRNVTASDGSSRPVTTTRHSAGDGRLLNAAARLAFLRCKVPNNTLLPTLPTDIDGDDLESAAENHPVEDCSIQPADQGVTSPAAADNCVANPAVEKRSGQRKSTALTSKSSNSCPVQQPFAPSAQLIAASQELGLTLEEIDEIALKQFFKLTQS